MTYTIDNAPLRRTHIWVVTVASMEQVIGTALSAVVGIMLPMMQLLLHPALPSLMQGIIGAIGLCGIGVGSMVIGRISDREGYLRWFRLCPVIIMAGSAWCFFFTSPPMLMVGLFLCGFGVGGGYSLDSAYISELMPVKWRSVMVGVAKASCSIGFIAASLIALWIIKVYPMPTVWPYLIFIVGGLGLLTLLMRIRWAGSPRWLMLHGHPEQAQEAITKLLGKGIEAQKPATTASAQPGVPWRSMFRGTNLIRVIYSGIPWACEGLGVYGFGVFLPIMIMALGIENAHAEGMAKVTQSVEVTTIVNCFILPGFVLGLLVVNRIRKMNLLGWGFIGSALGLGLLLWAYEAQLPMWVTISGFLIFEVALNGGPHLVTYIIPAEIYPVECRGAGSGIAAMLGKVGAVVGVILMPVLLEAGGMSLVLWVSISVMLAGALVGWVAGTKLKAR